MPTAISIANLEAALGEAYDAMAAGSYSSAFSWAARYAFQYAGIPKTSLDGASVAYPSPNDLIAAIKAAHEVGSRSGDQRRLIQFRLNYRK